MNILILGSGGREHVLSDAYAKNKKIDKIFILPGNPFIEYSNEKVECLSDASIMDFDSILKIIKKNKIELVDIGQEDPLAVGFVDKLSDLRIKVFGPTKRAAEIEWSKDFARSFMVKYGLPIPKYKSFNNTREAISYVSEISDQVLYIKASGLALGKGAIRAENRREAVMAIKDMKQFGSAGKRFLIEETIVGEEFSAFAVCDEENFKILGFAQDHKTLLNGDMGPNTGGMGALLNPTIITKDVIKEVEKKILDPFIKGMKKEGRPYSGIIFLGGMLTKSGVKIIEFNSRWGDPEAEVIIPSIQTDYLSIVEASIKGNLKQINIKRDNLARLSIVGCSFGYPSNYTEVKGKKVYGIKGLSNDKDVKVFGAGISKEGSDFVVSGGRVFHVMGQGKNLIDARRKAYEAISTIYIEGDNLQYRTDIGFRDIERIYEKK